MKNNKLETISNLFEGKEIRSIWDAEKEEYYFSVVDVIGALTDSSNPRNYWNMLKKRMTDKEKSELYTKCVQLKLKSIKDGKSYLTDTLDTKGILRLIESIPSSKAEPFKLWLANLGDERINEIFDPEIAINRAIDYYRNIGYSDKWIEARLKGILDRKKLTDVWKENGIKQNHEYGILTNEIYKSWSGMKASEYKRHKNIRKESLRDNMTDVEVALTDLGEIATRELTKEHKPYGLKENMKVAKMGGNVAKVARDDLEKKLGKTVISNKNSLNHEYVEDEESQKMLKEGINENYICKIASIEEALEKMEYEISIHPRDERWKIWKNETEKFLKEGKRICYIGMLSNIIICEATVAISKDALQNPEKLINRNTAYLFAFRTNKEYRGQGYFSKLYRFMENDLIKKGYKNFTLGVEPKDIENLKIYKHLGFTKFIKEDYEEDPPINSENKPKKVLVRYYLKET